jgi:uncharacterized protein (TIGR00730 family)
MGNDVQYARAAKELGIEMASAGHRLVYGGGNIGLMGVLADAVLENMGEVIGVIPDFLVKREVAHHGVTRLEVVTSMHQRKERMADLAQAFVALPGGWGTLDEVAEILTWRQLGLIDQPVGILNTNAFFSPLLAQMRLMVQEGFLAEHHYNRLVVRESTGDLLSAINT